MGKVILVSSGKGGTGKTMFSVNLGAILAQQGNRVMLLDMDMGLRNMDIYLGMENKVIYNIMDVISGVCRIKKAMMRVDGFQDLYFMAASPRRDDRDMTPLHMEVLCNKLRKYFDYIIIDCPAGIGDLFDVSMAAADKTVIVTEPEVASLRDADTTERYLREKGMDNMCIVVNKVKVELMQAGLVPGMSEIMNMFKSPVAGLIQYDENIHISTNKGIPIVCKSGTYIERNFLDIADRIVR
ncbi:MAG: septum site-determining protein MinD [Firmicutes bacterium]|nr:septum site-determining protein MinD [Bacillota bacterium]MBR3787869.1 septum site-determining protein MinD [Bacillota bacterium]MBR6799786.1 septum site-determining protein MinD [Bacillota bacterium]